MATEVSKRVAVSLRELVDACEFVSVSSAATEFRAYICTSTGVIYSVTGQDDLDEGLPNDIEESDQYISVPHKHDLNLGRRLVFSFIERELPDEYDRIRDLFRRRGAYGRFKDFLARRDMLDKWHQFEQQSAEEALRDWCEQSEIPLREP
jgi:Uncharacterised protein family (UPF0158)